MIQVIDSHTCGEPTRVIIKGGPDLGKGPLAERARLLEREHADFCRSVLREPRGYDAMVGVLLVEPVNKDCLTVAIFFNRRIINRRLYLDDSGHFRIAIQEDVKRGAPTRRETARSGR